ncbi:response regulator [Kriegella aquimaris]|uniref:CheY chemotaxis protein or a CheY-like REC (Receiver) domain n=1 Tax=Kriegella aquimaris TaxID=192904 RepID=A0A1G9TX00_9FLAO|nr:response regulator [Kriegella aquimaris]SDM51785.1 CheY chemotaxis protein or a CheY-like REC (receiver) domain [Kriegella aquimaris]
MAPKLNSILLVDDDPATNFVHRFVIKKTKLTEKVTVVENGKEALDYLQSNDNEPKPNIIFLDINMPIMNGWQFLEEYERLNANTQGDIVLIMLTTSLNPDDLSKANTFTTINGYRNKPLTTKMIEEIVEEYFVPTK